MVCPVTHKPESDAAVQQGNSLSASPRYNKITWTSHQNHHPLIKHDQYNREFINEINAINLSTNNRKFLLVTPGSHWMRSNQNCIHGKPDNDISRSALRELLPQTWFRIFSFMRFIFIIFIIYFFIFIMVKRSII